MDQEDFTREVHYLGTWADAAPWHLYLFCVSMWLHHSGSVRSLQPIHPCSSLLSWGSAMLTTLQVGSEKKNHLTRVSESLQQAEISPRVQSKSITQTECELWDLLGQEKVLCLNIHEFGVGQNQKTDRMRHLRFLSSPLKPGLYKRPYYFYFCETNQLKSWFIFESSILVLKCPSFPGEHMIILVLVVAVFSDSETKGVGGTRGPQLWQDMRKAGDQALPLQVSVLRAPRGITPKHVTHCC